MAEHSTHPETSAATEDAFPALARDLRGLIEIEVVVPAAVDDSVLNRARAHFAGVRARRGRVLRQRRLSWIAAAASIAIAATIALQIIPRRGPAIAGDIDRSGRVDILDAMALARMIHSQSPTSPDLDVNGDGSVDGSDVNWVARRAVSLGLDATRTAAANAERAQRDPERRWGT